jgi:hypothetical protein
MVVSWPDICCPFIPDTDDLLWPSYGGGNDICSPLAATRNRFATTRLLRGRRLEVAGFDHRLQRIVLDLEG